MRLTLSKTLLVAAFAAMTTIAASATPISGAISVADANGTYTYGSPGSLNYGPSGFITGIGNAVGATSNTFSTYFTTLGYGVSFTSTPMAFSAAGGTTTYPMGTELFTSTDNGETLTFYVTSETTMAGSNQSAISLTGTGYFTELGVVNYTQTVATFTTTGSVSNTTFQIGGTAQTPPPTVTPEPSSLVLLGTGIVGVAGVLRRKLIKA